MKIKFLATSKSPQNYTITGETINGLDLSVIEHGGKFVGNDDTAEAGIRDAYRDESGELFVTLKQGTIASKLGRPAHWRESDWMDAGDYKPDTCYVVPTGVADLTEGEDYQIVMGEDCTGVEGWTLVQVEENDNE
jgi:hypothetical protein